MIEELGPYHEAQLHTSMDRDHHCGRWTSERFFHVCAPCHRRDMSSRPALAYRSFLGKSTEITVKWQEFEGKFPDKTRGFGRLALGMFVSSPIDLRPSTLGRATPGSPLERRTSAPNPEPLLGRMIATIALFRTAYGNPEPQALCLALRGLQPALPGGRGGINCMASLMRKEDSRAPNAIPIPWL
jgi:hypothetical protein